MSNKVNTLEPILEKWFKDVPYSRDECLQEEYFRRALGLQNVVICHILRPYENNNLWEIALVTFETGLRLELGLKYEYSKLGWDVIIYYLQENTDWEMWV